MTAPLRKVALVAGSGHLGPHLLKALQADSAFDVTVVSRQSSKSQFPPSTNVVRVSDTYSKDEILDIFKDKDAVVLSLNFAAEAQHHNMLVDASVEAGVKRLIPSIWAGRLDIPEALDIFPIAALKAAMLEYVKSKEASTPGWSYTAVACGLFHDLCVQTNFYGIDPKSHVAKIWDDGETKFSASTYNTIGLALTKILSKPEETKNRTVYISSFETSINGLLAAYKSATGESEWNMTYENVDQGIQKAKETNATAENFMDKMRAIGSLALLAGLKKDLGADFVAAGVSDNELLGLPGDDVIVAVNKLLEG